MTATRPEPTVRDRLSERPVLKLARLRSVKRRDLVVRFLAGALTSVVAGIITLVFGARIGGTLLAFPAILGASLTLIEEEEDAADAREDSRGAIVGGIAMAAFAAVVAVTLGSVSPALALLLATCTWAIVALGGYFLLWWRRGTEATDR